MCLALALAAVLAGGTATTASAAISYPGPGWRYAAPATAITFRGVPARRLRGLRVRGSKSGRHRGQLRPLRLGRGAVFTPARPFRQDERVTVRAGVRLWGAPKGRFSFRTARRHGAVPNRARPGGTAKEPWRRKLIAPCALAGRTLRTLPGLHPQQMCTAGRVAGPGRLLVSLKPRGRTRGWAAAILSRTGRLLWFTQAPHPLNDLKVVELGGRRLLALYSNPPDQRAHYRLLDETYRSAGRIHAGNGYGMDSHDLEVGPRGTVYVGSYHDVWTGPRRRVTEYVVQELDPETGDVLFEWHSLDHVRPRRTTYRGRPAPGIGWDYFHGNAIEAPTRKGRTLLVSARNTSAIYAIDRRTGEVRWVLGGRRDTMGIRRHPSWRFCAQHDVRRTRGGDVTLFDNGGARLRPSACPLHPARMVRFRVDPARGRARLVDQVSSRRATEGRTAYFPGALGSARLYPGGTTLIDWGTTGRVTEHRPDGTVGFRLALRSRSYRAVLAGWTGRPAGRPRIAVERTGDGAGLDVYASWNGATDIRRWQLLAGPSRAGLEPVGKPVAFADLETRLRARVTAPAVVAVEARGAGGAVLGRSKLVTMLP